MCVDFPRFIGSKNEAPFTMLIPQIRHVSIGCLTHLSVYLAFQAGLPFLVQHRTYRGGANVPLVREI
jgi:hypothetical protein